MPEKLDFAIAAGWVALLACAPAGAQGPVEWTAADQREILDSTATIRLAPDLSALAPGERAAVDELLAAGGILQRIYEDERHPQAAAVRTRVELAPGSDVATLYRLFQGPIATTLDNRREAFVPVEPETPGKNVYPWGISEAEVEAFLAGQPERRDEILADRSVVRRTSAAALARDLSALERHPLIAGLHPSLPGRLKELALRPDAAALYAVPYSVAWADELTA